MIIAATVAVMLQTFIMRENAAASVEIAVVNVILLWRPQNYLYCGRNCRPQFKTWISFWKEFMQIIHDCENLIKTFFSSYMQMNHNISEEHSETKHNVHSYQKNHNISEESHETNHSETKHSVHSYPSSGNNSPTYTKKANQEGKGAFTNEYSASEATKDTDQVSKTNEKFANKTRPQKLSPPTKNISDAFTRQSPRTRMPANADPANQGISKGMPTHHTKSNSQGGPGSGTSSRSDSLESTSCSSNIRPHTGGDVRWDAINMALKNGPLNLSHFRLLKRIGYGDIGSVYLVELKGTDAHFAMKVMDKAALISRNKLLRSQTEREILGLLDHPFLPTLYSYFETDKFYCLVMEYCSGGDLHSLRQKQPNKCFTEEAARFVDYIFCISFSVLPFFYIYFTRH
jgi:hypothetical protein